MKTLKTCLVILCLLSVRTVGTPQFSGATSFMKRIPNFPNYSITRDGRVYSHKNKIYLKSAINGAGYLMVSLSNNGNIKNVNVHRLVAEAFVKNPNPLELDQVNHLDSDRSNSHYKNLEWSNQSLNCLYAYRVMKNKRHGSKLTFEQAERIRESSLSTRVLAKMYNVSQKTTQNIKSGKTYTEKHEISNYAKSISVQT